MTSRLAPPFTTTTSTCTSTSSTSQRRSSPSSHSLKRTSSVISLPSPPDELAQPSLKHSYLDIGSDGDLEDDDEQEEEVDQLDSDQDDDDEGDAHASTLNPFVVPSTSTFKRQHQEQEEEQVASRPDHPQASPTHRAKRLRKGRELDRVSFSSAEKGKGKGKGVNPKGMGRGWDSPSNPFIEREGEGEMIAQRVERAKKARKSSARGGEGKEEMVTYVFRGKRIHYDLPLSTLLTSEDPTSSPFADPSPRLLFPPAAPITPPSATPSSSFLDALRATQKKGGQEQQLEEGRGLPPTPVTEKRKPTEVNKEGRFGPYKRMKAMKEPEGGMRN
ncbi:hypothetical protein BCR35DRAFT_310450 [Leucosporidium creatinivorum]|uniref:Uncharacterized protein n=1 Tax=Leucosporidium creatinivorum TaxID=106004 RepID=A0A1Y2D4D9_9BASI|nr:hypothetical protein BCR35DRAFT_310450 [Leucosporidium creatinivorum]